jgi:hypothetical protein
MCNWRGSNCKSGIYLSVICNKGVCVWTYFAEHSALPVTGMSSIMATYIQCVRKMLSALMSTISYRNVTANASVFWSVTLCNPVEVLRRFV